MLLAFERLLLAIEPVIVVLDLNQFLVAKKNVQFVVAQHTLSTTGFNKTPHHVNNGRAVGATVSQIPKKDEPSSF